jgi:hypothetical protein
MVWKSFGQKERNPVEARQGYLDRPVLLVLAASLGAVVLIFAIIYVLYFG